LNLIKITVKLDLISGSSYNNEITHATRKPTNAIRNVGAVAE